MPGLLPVDLRGSPAMGGDRNHPRDDGSSEGPSILQASDIGRKDLHGEIQGGISDFKQGTCSPYGIMCLSFSHNYLLKITHFFLFYTFFLRT